MTTKGRIRDLQDKIDRIVNTDKRQNCKMCKGTGNYPGFTECPYCFEERT